MTLEKIRQKTQQLHAKTRRALLGGMTVPLVMGGICGWIIVQIHGGLVQRVVFAFAIAWSLAGQYFLNRGMWPATPPGVGWSTGLESYRREVERRRSLSGGFLLWSFGPIVLALAALIVPMLNRGMLLNIIPFLVLVVIWIVSVFIIRMRDQQELQRDIDELNDIERGNV
jgi:hypothetical protein